MHVASLELCKELYELSRWDGKHYYHYWNSALESDKGVRDRKFADFDDWMMHGGYRQRGVVFATPAYGLSYLLEKLPHFELRRMSGTYWAEWESEDNLRADIECWGKTPEDAAAKLCIALLKQKEITP